MTSPPDQDKPLVVVTGAGGDIGRALACRLRRSYRVIGLDRDPGDDIIAMDLTQPATLSAALDEVARRCGPRIASVIHLAAYFDFSGEESPLYEKVNVEGTRSLLRALQGREVEQFVYSGTMLVHKAGVPGVPISEATEIAPAWAYPESKAKTEEVIRQERGDIPAVLLHLAGLYDEESAVPTLAEQIRRIYERDPKAHAYSGDLESGQSMVHRDDMIDAFVRTVDRRAALPEETTILIGEPEAMGYGELQALLAHEIHGEDDWTTLSVPKPLAAAGAWLEAKSEPIVPDAFDQGEEPFIKPFMVWMADEHYALDISRARELLGWEPRHHLREVLPQMVRRLKADPAAWYEANGLTKPHWLQAAADRDDPDALRRQREREFRTAHAQWLWAPFLTIGLGAWLVASPPIFGHVGWGAAISDVVSGLLVMVGGFLALSWRMALVRWAVAAVGAWVMTAPLVFWTESAGVYLNDTLVGALIFGLAACARPAPGIGTMAATTGPTVPPGWDYSPSEWSQRIPVIALAFFGFFVSRYLTAYQLGHIDAVWEPFFAGDIPGDGKNGTEEIITSSVSEAWPVPDAGLGALTYALEILIGLVGSARRWRTMPWLVLVFGIMIVPLGIVSITFIIIQPILLGTWCTLCLMTAAAMLIQIPYSVDELVATLQFLNRRRKAGAPLLRVFLMGDTDDGPDERAEESFERPPLAVVREMLGGGIVATPWLLAASGLGLWLMFTRLTLGTSGTLADIDHLVGALAVTVAVTSMAEVVRAARFLNICLGAALVIAALVTDATWLQSGVDILVGLALMAVSVPRGPIRHKYGSMSRVAV